MLQAFNDLTKDTLAQDIDQTYFEQTDLIQAILLRMIEGTVPVSSENLEKAAKLYIDFPDHNESDVGGPKYAIPGYLAYFAIVHREWKPFLEVLEHAMRKYNPYNLGLESYLDWMMREFYSSFLNKYLKPTILFKYSGLMQHAAQRLTKDQFENMVNARKLFIDDVIKKYKEYSSVEE